MECSESLYCHIDCRCNCCAVSSTIAKSYVSKKYLIYTDQGHSQGGLEDLKPLSEPPFQEKSRTEIEFVSVIRNICLETGPLTKF